MVGKMFYWGFSLALVLVFSPAGNSDFGDTSNTGFVLPVYHITHPKYSAYTGLADEEAGVAIVKHPQLFKYFVEFGVGTPRVNVSVVLDTGSFFTWFSPNVFQFSDSDSYEDVFCDDDKCPGGKVNCDAYLCTYKYTYLENTTSIGHVIEDNITLMESAENIGNTTIRMVLGTADSNSKIPGILGLGYMEGGLTDTMNVLQFSLCLPRIPDDSSYIRFGDQARMIGPYIDMGLEGFHYTFKVGTILIGGEVVPVTNTLFKFDTGAVISRIHSPVMDAILRTMDDLFPGVGTKKGDYEYCILNRQMRIISGRQRLLLELVFEEGKQLNLGFYNTWVPYLDDSWCLSLLRSPREFSVLGAEQMKDINFGLDMGLGRLYYEVANCAS